MEVWSNISIKFKNHMVTVDVNQSIVNLSELDLCAKWHGQLQLSQGPCVNNLHEKQKK